MSLFDMYFSKKNKNHMYDILCKLVLKETGYNIQDEMKFINIYQYNYGSIFYKINTDNLIDLNKEIINSIGSEIIKDIKYSDIKYSDTINIDENIDKNIDENKKIQVLKKNKIIYSNQRLLNSLNRYNFSVKINFSKFNPKSLILIKEKNSLFSNPNINILFNNTDNLLFILKSSNIFNNQEYLTYEPLLSDIILCDQNILKIQIKNYLMNNPFNKKDYYEIQKIKRINYKDKEYLCFEIKDKLDIHKGTEIGLFQINKETLEIEYNCFIQDKIGNYLLTDLQDIDLNNKYSFLFMNQNITLNGYSFK